MKPFWLERAEDESGVSGVGRVAEGIIFSSGWCAMAWLTQHPSITFYQAIEDVEVIHGHEGDTKIHIGQEVRVPKT